MSEAIDLSQDRLVRTMIQSALASTKRGATDIEGKVAEMYKAIEACDDETVEQLTKGSRGKSLEEWVNDVVRLGGAAKDLVRLVRSLRLK